MEINGLPLHPLVVHGAVVFGPVAALMALVFVAVPRWRDRVRWPMVVVAVLGGVFVVAAFLSGGNYLDANPGLEQLPAVRTHESRADYALWSTLAFAVVALVAGAVRQLRGAAQVAVLGLLAVTAVATLVSIVLTGDAGAQAVWS